MDMSFDQYIQNPMGHKNAVISNREILRTAYTDKLNKVLLRENGKIDYTIYKDSDNYYCHLKIPSEVIKDFYYDTVIQFIPSSKTSSMEPSLSKYKVKFYSNDPSFVYTFAHAFIKNNMFIKDLEPKMSKEAIRKAAVEKNPTNQVGYVKSIYFAYLYMKSKGLFNKVVYKAAGKYDSKLLLSNIMNANEKIRLRQEAQVELDKSKKKNKSTDKNRESISGNTTNRNNSLKVMKSKKIGSSKTTGKVKTSKISKRV